MHKKRFTAKPIGIRLRPSDRQLVERAAEVAECSLLEFGRRAVLARARRVLGEGANAPQAA